MPGWFASPTAFDHVLYNYTDNSAVETLITFPTNFGDEEAPFLYPVYRKMAIPAGTGFIDGTDTPYTSCRWQPTSPRLHWA